MDPARHAHERNALESLVRQIPGFRGYLEEEYRRESDHLTRSWMADQLAVARQAVDRRMRDLVDRVRLDELPPWERLRGRIDAFGSRLRGADRGYSGLFDFVRTGEAELEQVYRLDLSLTDGVAAFTAACRESSGGAGAPAADPLSDLQTRLDELETRFQQRAEILQGLKK